MKTKIAITTTSWIRSNEENEIVLQTIKHLSLLNLPMVIVDRDSPVDSKDKIKKMPNVSFFETNQGLQTQLIQSFKETAKLADNLLYLHTDKLDFVKNYASDMIEKYLNLPTKGILIASRDEKSWDSYPPYQKKQEEYLNFFLGDYVGFRNDYIVGIFILPGFLVKYLDNIKGNIGWGIESYLYVIAKRLGLHFDFYPCTLSFPKDVDTEEKIKNYRLLINKWHIDGFLQAQNVKL